MNFKEATDILMSTPQVTLARVAEVFGKEMHTIARARMEGPNSRKPPTDWKPVLARVAREYALELRLQADELERLGEELAAD